MNTTRNIHPTWAANCDSTADITDNLHDADSEARDYGHVATAYFDHAAGVGYDIFSNCEIETVCPRLIGISITNAMGATGWHSEKDAALILGSGDPVAGAEIIDRIETVHSEGME